MKKKLLILMLSASMVLSMSACGATKTEEKSQAATSSADDSTSGDEENSEATAESNADDQITYEYSETVGGIMILGYEGGEEYYGDMSEYTGPTDRVLEIPSEIDGNTVVEINGITADCSVSKVVIPDTVTDIGPSSFSFCNSLTDVTLGSEVTTIDAYAFTCCDKLESLYVPASVTDIGKDALIANADFTVYGEAGSYVETYCQENDINFVAQ